MSHATGKRALRGSMRMTLGLLGLVAGAGVCVCACVQTPPSSTWDAPDLKPPRDFVAPPVRPLTPVSIHERVGFVHGFWPLEFSPSGKTWHWMGAHGELRLQNDHRQQRLRLVGWLPLEFLTAPPTIRLTLGRHVVDTFAGSAHELDRAYVIQADWLGVEPTVLLTIDTSATASAPGDPRELGVSIESVTWRDADPQPPLAPPDTPGGPLPGPPRR